MPATAARPPRRSRRPRTWGCLFSLLLTVFAVAGCRDDTDLVRQIQRERQAKQQARSQQDHLGEVFLLLRQYIDLEPDKASRQIAYHLNRWSESRPPSEAEPPELLSSITDVLPPPAVGNRVLNRTFQPGDADHLRDSFLFNRLYSWVDVAEHDERLLVDWFQQLKSKRKQAEIERLRTATRLFDWTIRNVALEPADPETPAPPGPEFPLGMKFRGPGYRQTDFQTVMRGTGDGLQRAGVFTQLCRQAGIPAAVLGTIDGTTGEVTPFCVGVLAGEDIYLFEPNLGIFVPGPGQEGIATLAQARRDALVLRRLGIAGLDRFTYPVGREDVQQCVALLNFLPETVSPRMQSLQAGLTGNRRMNVYVDAADLAERFDAVTGISGVRLWDVPLLAEIYQQVCQAHSERDPVFAFWFNSRWAMMDAEYQIKKAEYELDAEYGSGADYRQQAKFETVEPLAHGRWRHLLGQFSDDDEDNVQGARTLYLAHRNPEFEIEDLSIDVELQKRYGIRRELGVDPAVYNQQVASIQHFMMLGKRTATYWLSLLQADDGRLETAEGWIRKRVLDETQPSIWIPAARYNLARLAEEMGDTERAIELYKRQGEPQEHGNRIRARLVSKSDE